ncbi:SRPBCC family protein [Geodermatophilus sp. SYSU D00697]
MTSAALGVPQVARSADFARSLAVGDAPRHRAVTELVGVGELVAAAGLLGRPHPAWLWGRVCGDALDLSLMRTALRHHDGRGLRRSVLAMAGLVVTAVDVYAAATRTIRKGTATPMELTSATTVTRPPEEVYAFWRQLDRLPTFMAHLDEVRATNAHRSHWKASAPFGRSVEWDAETTDDVPGQRIAWRSLDGADVPNSGQVDFVPAPGGRGTEVHVTLTYELPGGALGKAVAKYFGEEPSQQLDDDLRRFKQVLETGEVIRSDGAPRGKQAREEFPQHPARPLTDDERREVLA